MAAAQLLRHRRCGAQILRISKNALRDSVGKNVA
jgi:hypothetical protein